MRINAIIAAAFIALIPLAASAGEVRQNPVHNAASHRAEGGQQQMHARHKHHRHARHARHAQPANAR